MAEASGPPESPRSWPDPSRTGELLAQARDGDGGAVEDLLERHRPGLRRMVDARIDRRLERRVDASDIVQDVLLEASQRLEDYLRDPRLPFSLWLRQLAQDRVIDMHRRHRLAGRRSLDREQPLQTGDEDSSRELVIQLRDPELTPAAHALREELRDQFLHALGRMDEADREILMMRHFEQLSNSEAAELLGLSEPAAGMRHLRALRRLRVILGDDTVSREG
ncbi:MAG: sigma-70 family RNA polymerase sigma factor [Planctomycetaceae bacterium]|jgi:RNA polymerase sigma-70 factor (ECF subfamily)